MQNKTPDLGALGSKFFSYTQMKSIDIVHIGGLQQPLGISKSQERKLLFRLNKSGFIFRLLRATYIVPKKIPPGGFWRPNDYLIVAKYMEYYGAIYYIGGLTAFNKYGFSTQVPNQLSIYNDKISGLKVFGGMKTLFHKVSTKSLVSGFDEIKIPLHKEKVNIANLARTILDAINYYKHYSVLPEAYSWMEKNIVKDDFLKDFINLTVTTANTNSIRRIGYYIEKLKIDKKYISLLFNNIKLSKGWVLLNPNESRKGKTNKKWGIIDNA